MNSESAPSAGSVQQHRRGFPAGIAAPGSSEGVHGDGDGVVRGAHALGDVHSGHCGQGAPQAVPCASPPSPPSHATTSTAARRQHGESHPGTQEACESIANSRRHSCSLIGSALRCWRRLQAPMHLSSALSLACCSVEVCNSNAVVTIRQGGPRSFRGHYGGWRCSPVSRIRKGSSEGPVYDWAHLCTRSSTCPCTTHPSLPAGLKRASRGPQACLKSFPVKSTSAILRAAVPCVNIVSSLLSCTQ